MKQSHPSYFEIKTKESAAYLSKLKNMNFLQPFLESECTIAQAADITKVKEHQMQYFVTKMLKFKLIEVSKEEKRSGKPVKYYRCVADSFFIPLDYAPYADLTSYFSELANVMLEEQINYQAKAMLKKHEHERFGFWINHDDEAKSVRFQLIPSSKLAGQETPLAPSLSESPSFIGVGRIKLSHETAQRLRESLKVFNEIAEEEEGEYYFYRVAMTPVID